MLINEIEISLISDGIGHVDAGGVFGLVPRASYEDYLMPDTNNRVPSAFYSLVIKEHDAVILVDTGLGHKLSQKEKDYWNLDRTRGDLVENLAQIGLQPGDIDLVINTHLHSDHCGGNTRFEGGKAVATYPNAEYVFQRIEWAEACHPNPRTKSTYFKDNFAPLVSSGHVRMLHGDEIITPHIRCVVTPGHTRGHQSVLLNSGDWQGLFLGDLASRSFQFSRTSWVAAYDVDPIETIRTKQVWQEWAVRTGAWLFFMHDHQIAIARLVENDGRYALQPIELDNNLIVTSPNVKLPLE
jgi:glyoxylase-like metal-dependent hydrolase (beta-lactamase superfamily II)